MRTLFVDFAGTLCHDRFWRNLPIREQEQIHQLLFETNSALVDDWMRGRHTSESINKFVSDRIGISYEALWGAFIADCNTMQVSENLLQAIDPLRDHFHTVLLTGNMDCFDRFTVPALKLERRFDAIVNSYNEGCLKAENSGASFKRHAKGDVCDAVLVDDSVASCAVFEKLGGTAFCATSEQATLQFLRTL